METNAPKLLSTNKFVLLVILCWSGLILISFYSNIHIFEEHSIRLATTQANAYWNKDSAFRIWASRHGGVYVKPDERTPPNPLLAHLPHRDIETTDGTKLTLMNPAYMMRQMAEEFGKLYGITGKITAQVLMDPEKKRNKPDAWELNALKQFETGKTEVTELTQLNGESYLRMMRPIRMKQGCLLCHGLLGFKVGDIRGGVSVSVPLKPFEKADEAARNQSFISHITIWFLGIYVIIYIETIKRKQTLRDQLAKKIINRSVKMDALGKLTGGIAHDYNNMLGVISGYSELLKRALHEQPKLAKYAKEIHRASERGSALTKKLLSFSKKEITQAHVLNINTLLREQQFMLEKTLTARIKLVFELEENLWSNWLDDNDIEDSILNMCINSMHAIKGNGQITIRTSNERLNNISARALDIEPGDYVMLSITDTGCGIDKEDKEKIFDPFYSTKGELGTGLGLSQVYGFVRRSGGAITVYSEEGHGTQFVLYFPRYNRSNHVEKIADKNSSIDCRGDETILIIDDEQALLNLGYEILSQQGYNVLRANSCEQALEILEQESVDLLLTDIIMPKMDGYELAAIVQKKYPDVKIQLASGYTDNRNTRMIDGDLQENLLHKPYNSEALLLSIRTLLDKK